MDYFAQFFIAPLLKLDSMQREREAVDSEFQVKLIEYRRSKNSKPNIIKNIPFNFFAFSND